MEKLQKLIEKCKGSVILYVNDHKNSYESVEELIDKLTCEGIPEKIHEDIMKKMVETDTLIDLQFYPDTPIGSYTIYHYDLDMALDEALKIIEE